MKSVITKAEEFSEHATATTSSTHDTIEVKNWVTLIIEFSKFGTEKFVENSLDTV